MTQQPGSWIEHVGAWVMVAALGVLPVFFLPMTQEYYDTNKWMLLVVSTSLLLLLWGLRVLATGTATLAWNGVVKRFGLLAIAGLVSLFVSPNKIEAILAPFGVGTLLSLFLIATIGSTFLDEKAQHVLRWVLMTTVSLAGLLAIYQFFGLGKDPLWTPVGTSVGLMTILIVTLPMIIHEALHRTRSGHDNHMIVAIVMGIACIGGLVLTAYQTLPKWNETILPYWVNWQILLESYKNWKHLLAGVGAENFLAAFTTGRPAALNMTTLWNTRFTLGSTTLFHIATVYGLLGTAAIGWFLLPMRGSFFLAALSLIFLPPSFPVLIVVTTILIISESAHSVSLKRPRLSWLIAIIVFLLAGASSYGLIRAYGAELAFGRSLTALQARDGTGAYNLQIRAITLNPRVTRFHTAYSQTNIALANALVSTATGSADRQTTTQLIQQAIREAKIGVNLAPRNILAWENLAAVYQTLTGAAKGADQWAVAAYQQAVTLDPTNPVIRLRLGGAYVGSQKLDLAAQNYLAAIALKPDYANAYYNLAFSYREQKKYVLAAQTLKETLKYVTAGSNDGSRAQKELDELRGLLTEDEKRSLDTQTQTVPAPQTNTSPEPLSPLP